MFHRQDKKENPLSLKSVKDLSPVLTASQILSDEKRKIVLHQLKTLCAFDNERYKAICETLVINITNHCQSLPETLNSYYARPAGIIDYALHRTETVLQLFMQSIVQKDETELTEIQQLWLYALYTASLLKDIGKLQIDYHVKVFDNHSHPIKNWNPLIENLISIGSLYHFEFMPDREDKIILRQRINLILAHQLMPSKGFAWIASHPNVLATWLALLSDDWRSAGTLGALLVRADAAAIQRYFNEYILPQSHRKSARSGRIGTFVDSTLTPEALLAKEQMLGVEFIHWLTASLESGRLLINKAPLLIVPGGLLVGTEAFKLFIQSHPEYKNWQAVQTGFLSLGLHRLTTDGNTLSRFEQTNNQQIHSGILFKNYAVALPQSVRLHSLYTGAVTQVSAIELIHLAQLNHPFTQQQATSTSALQHLTANGEWKTITNQLFIKPGPIKSG